MNNFWLFLGLSAAMGLSIFLSFPIIYSKRAQGRWSVALNAGAIGILIFLLADVFADVAALIYPSGYVANLTYSVAFGGAFLLAFLGLFVVDNLPRGSPMGAGTGEAGGLARAPESGPWRTALMIAIGIGLQNLTEGLVFGVNWRVGTVGVLAVVFLGFFLQNFSEGFPIASPFLGTQEPRKFGALAGLFLLGGLPTIVGGVIGYSWSNNLFLVVFDALAIGAIAYAILPMLRVAFRPLESKEASVQRNQIVYLGVMIGFLIGFAVNAL